ncbi:MAG: hypothetical protein KZQ91_02175 [Candidatus Thiodiazotropha sp. (ex Lucinoma borealis)]|nr:hypothetical protein [Candidatus Thiodiazotropha sp. (ex Lucinoma borealis)]
MNSCLNNAFSLRRLNPFNGTLQVFNIDTARALSSNGIHWEIQVLSDSPQGLWANMPYSGQQYYTFGLWSVSEGLKQVPINPLFNVRDMIKSSEQLIEQLQTVVESLPFPLADRYELWLLDEEEKQPVTLLQSCRTEQEMALNSAPKWIAAVQGDFSFISNHLLKRGLKNNDGYNPRVHTSVLEATVRGRGGENPTSLWFFSEKGGYTAYSQSIDVMHNKWHFPKLPLCEDWKEQEEKQLISDYIAYKAPQMLMLPDLSSATRDRLEQVAVKQAEVVERLWRLYPKIHNKELLNSARIEAKIRSANRK